MSTWKLTLLLFLTLTTSTETKDERQLLVRGGGSQEVIPVCSAETAIVLVMCRIRTDKEQGDECQLFYKHNRGFENNCSSRFTLTLVSNQNASLHLSSLTPEDSGNYTCECSMAEGVHTLYLNITVIDDGVDDAPVVHVSGPLVLIGVTAVVPVAAAFLGLIAWIRNRNRGNSESAIPGSPVCKSPGSLAPDQTYFSIHHTTSHVYQNILKADHQDADVCMIYENI